MQNNKLRMAIRSTAAVALLGVAAQSNAVSLNTGDYETSLYGFARVAASYDFDEEISNGGQAGNFSAITTGNAPDTIDGHFGMDAYTSRLGVLTKSPEGVEVRIEIDFDLNNSIAPRLRQAYGSYNGLLIGQTWSNYNSFAGNTSVLDWDGLPGTAGVQGRVAQIRYTTGPLSFSLEEPQTYDIAGGTEKSGFPTLTAKLADSQGGISYAAGVMAKQTGFDEGTVDDSAVGFGAFLAGKFAVSDMISIQGSVGFSDGANGYVYRAGGNFGTIDGFVDANGDLETVEAVGGALGASVSLGGGRSINVAYGTASSDLGDAVDAGEAAATDTETNTMIFVNYMWSPVKNVTMGVEFANLETETEGGDDGDANRVMYLAQYNF